MPEWSERRILIIGQTYPSYSNKYVENVCTGAIMGDNFDLARVHPIPKRYMEEGQQFRSFQWITAQVAPHVQDGRPESWKVEPGSIRLGERIDPKNAADRVAIIKRSRHMCSSVEELKERWKRDGTSMGIIQPRTIEGVRLRRRSETERLEWVEKEQEVLRQESLPIPEAPKPLDWPEVEFLVKWTCDDPACATRHEMGIKTWGLHELYRKLKRDRDPDCDEKTLAKMRTDLDLSTREIFFFLGSFRARTYQFGLMDSYSAKRDRLPDGRQGSLF